METLVELKNVLCQILIIGLLLKLFIALFIPKSAKKAFWNTTKILFKGGSFIIVKSFCGMRYVATKIHLRRVIRKEEQVTDSNHVKPMTREEFRLAKENGE